MVWLVYDFVRDETRDVYSQTLRQKVFTQFKPALDKITLSEAGDVASFVNQLQAKLRAIQRGATAAQVSDMSVGEPIEDE